MSKQKRENMFCDYCGKTEMHYKHTIKTEMHYKHTINKYYYCGRCKEIKKEKQVKK